MEKEKAGGRERERVKRGSERERNGGAEGNEG